MYVFSYISFPLLWCTKFVGKLVLLMVFRREVLKGCNKLHKQFLLL